MVSILINNMFNIRVTNIIIFSVFFFIVIMILIFLLFLPLQLDRPLLISIIMADKQMMMNATELNWLVTRPVILRYGEKIVSFAHYLTMSGQVFLLSMVLVLVLVLGEKEELIRNRRTLLGSLGPDNKIHPHRENKD